MVNWLKPYLASCYLCAFALTAPAWGQTPRPLHEQTPGWGPWQPPEQIQAAQIDSGFSNLELGGYLDFQYVCSLAQQVPMEDAVIWFRVNDLVTQLGTGEVEFGCVVGNEIVSAMHSTAINRRYRSVDCWQINTPDQSSLPVYEDYLERQKTRAVLTHGTKVDPGSYPALLNFPGLAEQPETIWALIAKPVEGWIEFGRLGSSGNFRRCPGP